MVVQFFCDGTKIKNVFCKYDFEKKKTYFSLPVTITDRENLSIYEILHDTQEIHEMHSFRHQPKNFYCFYLTKDIIFKMVTFDDD